MKKTFAYIAITAALTLTPVVFTTGCAVMQKRESAGHGQAVPDQHAAPPADQAIAKNPPVDRGDRAAIG